jgi:hypothetical protein
MAARIPVKGRIVQGASSLHSSIPRMTFPSIFTLSLNASPHGQRDGRPQQSSGRLTKQFIENDVLGFGKFDRNSRPR